MSAPPHPSSPAIFGREREQSALRDALAAALAGRGSLVLVGGEAGIGKTVLAEWLLAEAAAGGAAVLVGRAYDLTETPPYGPWRELFAAAPRDGDLPALPGVLDGDEGWGTSPTGQGTIVPQARGYLAALAARRPLVLLLDDLHWADPASLELLRVVARGLGTLPLLLLATYRNEELGRGHPLYALLPILVREARAARLDLPRLSDPDLGALVGARYRLGDDEAARLVAHLRERSRGNPFYAEEILRSLEEAGLLAPAPGTRPTAGHPPGGGAPAPGTREAGGGWHLGALAGLRVPALLRQVIDARVARLGAEAERALAIAAVIGQEVPLAVWSAVAATDLATLLGRAEGAIAARLLDETADGLGVRFAHALIREALYEGLGPFQRRDLHRRAAEALLAGAHPDPDAVAGHLQRAGDARAATWLARAGERAQRAYAFVTAAARFEAALALPDAPGRDPGERGWLHYRLARMRRYTDPVAALAHLDEAARVADTAGDPALVAGCLYLRGVLLTMDARNQAGLASLRAGLAALEALPPGAQDRLNAHDDTTRGEMANRRGMVVSWLALSGLFADALALGEPTAAALPGDPGEVARLGNGYGSLLRGLGFAYTFLGLPEESRAALARSHAVFRAGRDHASVMGIILAELNIYWLAYAADRPAMRRQLEAENDTLRELAGAMGHPDHASSYPRLELLDGRWDAAEAGATPRSREAIGPNRLNGHAMLARLTQYRGEREACLAHIGVVLPDGTATAHGASNISVILEAQQIAIDLALDAGDLPAARAWLESLEGWLDWSGAVYGRAACARGWAGYHRAAGDLAAARPHADAALAHAAAPRQPLALLAAHRALGEVATAAGQHAEAARHLADALALADACAAPYERALILLARADLHLATGAPPAASVDLDAARAILAPLRAAPALARADALAARLPAPPPGQHGAAGLSAREIEVLRLVAEGLTDAEVAARLSLARRTIGTHLNSIYTKLGVNTRTAAARAAQDLGLL